MHRRWFWNFVLDWLTLYDLRIGNSQQSPKCRIRPLATGHSWANTSSIIITTQYYSSHWCRRSTSQVKKRNADFPHIITPYAIRVHVWSDSLNDNQLVTGVAKILDQRFGLLRLQTATLQHKTYALRTVYVHVCMKYIFRLLIAGWLQVLGRSCDS